MSHLSNFVFLVVNPGCSAVPQLRSGESLAILQEYVGGMIETAGRLPLEQKGPGRIIRPAFDEKAVCIDAYCNEDGLALKLSPNRLVGRSAIVGPIVVCASNEDGETISLDASTLPQALSWVRSWPIAIPLPEEADL